MMTFKEYERIYLDRSHTIWLSISNVNLSDLNGIERYQTLGHLDLRNNNISDLSPLAELQNLHSIYISNNTMLDLTPLTKCERLTTLGLRKMNIKNAHAIGEIKNLTKFSIMEVALENLSFLQKTQPLNEITLSSPFLTNIGGLKGMTTLEVLTIINCVKGFFTIENSKTILELQSLKSFNFYSNITSTSNFEELFFRNNNIQLINDILANKFKRRIKYNNNLKLFLQ